VAILHNFAYAQIKAERREAVRVKVNAPLSVTFVCQQAVINGTMIDISASGVSLLSATPLPATIEQTGVMSFMLEGTPLTTPAQFVRAKNMADGQQIAIFTITPDRITDSAIGRYIYQRQVEVILALKDGLVVE
jgi:c-di-GMP-binding flagellar brake protein YcgR